MKVHSNITIILFAGLFLSFVLEISLGVKLSPVRGASFRNLSFYFLIIFLIIGNPVTKIPVIQKNSINIPIFALLIYCFCSILYTNMVHPKLYDSLLSALFNFKSYIEPFILALITFSIVHDKKTVKTVLTGLIILFLIFNLLTIISSLGIVNIERISYNERLGRSRGAFSEGNQYAAYITLFIPFCVNFFWYNKNRFLKIVLGLAILTGLFSILLTGSRGGLLSLLIGSVVLLFLNSKTFSPGLILRGLGLVFIVGFLMVSTYFLLPETSRTGIVNNIVERAGEGDINKYSSGRIDAWITGLKLFAENPVTGTGFQTFSHYFKINTHNDYVLYLATLGAPGFFLFLLIYFRIFKSIWIYRRQKDNLQWYYNGYLSGFISYMVAMFFVNMLTPAYFFFIFTALILKMGCLQDMESKRLQIA